MIFSLATRQARGPGVVAYQLVFAVFAASAAF
jgi:hypothetical protein